MDTQSMLKDLVRAHEAETIAFRRHLHQHPELSFEEFETSDYLARQLTEMGYAPRRSVGGTGILAVLDTGRPGPVIAFRADMDALPMREDTGLPFASCRGGVMHACGHDCHMAVLLGLARVLCGLREELCGVVKLIFQPGEEANGGARCTINDGVLRAPEVEAVFALHVLPTLNAGTIGIKAGHMSATDDEVFLRIHGVSAHSSTPQEGVNAITVAAQVVTALQSLQANCISPFDVATFSLCRIRGGESNNIIPDTVELEGMIRCLEQETKAVFRERIQGIAAGIAAGFGGTAEVQFTPGFPAVRNDPELTGRVIAAAELALSAPEDVIRITRPNLGSEDFSYFQEEVPGVLFILGAGAPGEDRGGLHTTTLNINEDCLRHGVGVFGGIALSLCGRSDRAAAGSVLRRAAAQYQDGYMAPAGTAQP